MTHCIFPSCCKPAEIDKLCAQCHHEMVWAESADRHYEAHLLEGRATIEAEELDPSIFHGTPEPLEGWPHSELSDWYPWVTR